jgi:hypothetical protein
MYLCVFCSLRVQLAVVPISAKRLAKISYLFPKKPNAKLRTCTNESQCGLGTMIASEPAAASSSRFCCTNLVHPHTKQHEESSSSWSTSSSSSSFSSSSSIDLAIGEVPKNIHPSAMGASPYTYELRQTPNKEHVFPTKPTTTPSHVASLPSALRTSTYSPQTLLARSSRPTTHHSKLNVRGLWNENTCPLAVLHDQLLGRVFRYTSTADLVRLTMVSRRCRHVANHYAWDTVDVTDTLTVASHYYSAARANQHSTPSLPAQTATSFTVTALLERHNRRIQSLTIRNIGYRLTAVHFLPCLQNLQELVLTQFQDLTDTAMHVLLLGTTFGCGRTTTTSSSSPSRSSSRRTTTSGLRRLTLADCPLLTDHVVRSMAQSCPHLEYVNVAVGCPGIQDVTLLQTHGTRVVVVVAAASSPRGTTTTTTATTTTNNTSNLVSLFVPPSRRRRHSSSKP